jgi:endonuclease/exonuclease/phosphatase (EEP) superfamily protein YafD
MGTAVNQSKLTNVYVGFVIIWALERLLFFDKFWPFALLNTIAPYLFIPLPILLLIATWRRQWSALMKLSIPTLFFVVLFGRLFSPPLPQTSQTSTQPTLTVMSFNVLFKNKDYEAIASTIQAALPDLIGLQEMTDDVAQALSHALEKDYPYHTLDTPEEESTVALLSRFPIDQWQRFRLPPLDKALQAVINVNGQRIQFFVVHHTPKQFFERPNAEFMPMVKERYARRANEIAQLRTTIAKIDEPVLLFCDCNLTDTSEAHAQFSTFLVDSFGEAGWGFGNTFQPPVVSMPIQRIDYVWHSEEWIALEAFVGQDGHSDHLPIVAKLGFVTVLYE